MTVNGENLMRIGFDISQTAENMAGCGYFACQLISHLLEQDKNNKYLLYPTFYKYRYPGYKAIPKFSQPNAETLFLNHSWARNNELWDNKSVDKNELLGFPEIVHCNTFYCPNDITAKKVVTMYDVGFLDCPEFTTEANRLVCFEGAYRTSLYADYVIAISESSRNSFLRYFPHYPENRISVVYLGSRPTLGVNNPNKALKSLQAKVSLDCSYWLGVGTIEPRKNYRLLLKAFAHLVNNEFTNIQNLYIAGGRGWHEENIRDLLLELKISDKVKFLGYVNDEELAVLYSKCYAFIYPSHYEGFGLPVLEAMSCGAPVITSATTSLPEVGGEAVLYIDPKSMESLVAAMQKIEKQADLRERMILQSKSQVQLFSWSKAAKEVLEIYEKVMELEPWNKFI